MRELAPGTRVSTVPKPSDTQGSSATAGGRRAAPDENLGGASQRGAYLTDGVFLYRVVDPVAGRGEETVELEDCYDLGIVRVPVAELRRRNLRVVVQESA